MVRSLLSGAQPMVPGHSVCMECKRRGNVCVVVARGEPCLGSRDARRMRSAVSVVQSRMLWMLRAGRRSEYGIVRAIAGRSRAITGDDAVRRLRGINGYVRPWRETADAIAAGTK